MNRNIVVFSTLSKDHDISSAPDRWFHWRPIVELMRAKNFPVRKLYFFVFASQKHHVDILQHDLLSISPNSEIIQVPTTLSRDFSTENIGETYKFFSSFFKQFVFKIEKEDYYFHFGPGNLFSHAFMLTILINTRKLPFKIVHLRSPQKNKPDRSDTKVEIYDCAINKWISEIGTFEKDNADLVDYLKSSIKTRNSAFNKLILDVEHIATHSTAPILFSGPTGSGKSKLARKIYELRLQLKMISGSFVEINCATLRGDSAMSTLFGHAKGAFTGAITARKGLLRMANNGILFLDEIGDLTLDMQVLLLKAIEEQRFIPFGADEEVNSAFQLICATNKDLKKAVIEGTFRPDLLSRINLWHFQLPSLRERPEDIEPNIDYELQHLTAEKGIFAEFTSSAKKAYLEFGTSPRAIWPYNFRSLLGSLERMITYSFNGVIDDNVVRKEINFLTDIWKEIPVPENRLSTILDSEFCLLRYIIPDIANKLDWFDKIQLEATIQVCLNSSSRSEAGRKLFSCSRERKKSSDDTARLNKYLKSYGLTWEILQRKCQQQDMFTTPDFNFVS